MSVSELCVIFFWRCAHGDWFHELIVDKIVSDLAGGQGDAETRPERRARSQDRRRGAMSVPFLLVSPGLAPKRKISGGLGGRAHRPSLQTFSLSMGVPLVCLVGGRRRFELRSIVCGFARSRSLRPECDPTTRSGDSRTRLHPNTSLREFGG